MSTETEITYDLKKPFQYARGGDFVEASFITLRAPSYPQMAHFVPLKQAFSAAIRDMSRGQAEAIEKAQAEPKDEAKTEALDGGTVLSVLYQGEGDVFKAFLHAQELFRSGAALVDGETKITKPVIEAMDPADFEALVGEYLAAFVAPSLMGGQ